MSAGSRQATASGHGPAPLTLAAYAAPAFAFAIPTLPVLIFLPAIYADGLGLGLAATGAALLASRLFDMATDPLIGLMSDRTRARMGRRKVWIMAGAPVAALGFLMLAFPPSGIGPLYLTAWLMVLYLGWTAVQVPYSAWGAELSPDYRMRTRITAVREGAAIGGILLASAIPVVIGGTAGTQFAAIALTAIGLGALALVALGQLVPDPSTRQQGAATARPARPVAETFRQALANGPFLRLVAAWFANGLANGLPAALFILYLTHGLKAAEAERPLFILAYFLAAIVCLPLWTLLSARIGKHRAWCLAMLAACLAFLPVPFLPAGATAAFMAICIVTGAALGADLALPPAMQADVVDFDRLRHGEERTGTYFAVWLAVTKAAAALSAGLGLAGVAAAGFDPAAPTPAGIAALAIAYAGVPVVLKLVAVALIWGFPITARRQAAIRRRLDQASAA
ncbi:MFS transporter [Phreatobacter sp.]|uniref:MFS transporter n=1 Tax=Phreatobacter sp. TaxID=1966341 RepID=UPI003F71AD15